MSYLEIIGRVAIIYVACFALLRLSGRREMSELSPMDLLAMLLLSETVSPALTGGKDDVPTGLVAATTLVALSVLTSWIVFRSRKLEKIIQGDAVLLIRDGKIVDRSLMRRYRLTDDELHSTFHQHGVMAIDEVARAYVEADGSISIVTRKDFDEAQQRREEAIAQRGGIPRNPAFRPG